MVLRLRGRNTCISGRTELRIWKDTLREAIIQHISVMSFLRADTELFISWVFVAIRQACHLYLLPALSEVTTNGVFSMAYQGPAREQIRSVEDNRCARFDGEFRRLNPATSTTRLPWAPRKNMHSNSLE